MKEFKHIKIDVENSSTDDIRKEISRLRKIYNNADNKQLALKVFLNSFYGAIGNEYFRCYDVNIAESITLQGQDLIKYMNKVSDIYFKKKWHRDKKLHKYLGVSDVSPIPENEIIVPYGDTDSVHEDTYINCENDKKIKVKDLFSMYKDSHGVENDHRGNELILNDGNMINVLNHREDKIQSAKIKRIIRHKVTKDKWKIKTKSGREIIVTNDHSLVVVRNGKKIEVKPIEMLKTDTIITIIEKDRYFFDNIQSVEMIGQFEDEYVYDIEIETIEGVEDIDNHTFFANDMLVHNSNYVTFKPAMDSCKWKGTTTDFIEKVYKFRLKEFYKVCLDKFSKKYNTENYQEYEMEAIAHSGMFLKKKNYILDVAWTDSGTYFDSLDKLVYKGISIVRGDTPIWCRSKLKELTRYVLDHKHDLNYSDFMSLLNNVKSQFKLQDLNIISSPKNIKNNGYDKYILNDKNDVKIAPKCPVHIKSSAIYNNILYKNPKFATKYEYINNGDLVRWYYTPPLRKGDAMNVFAFKPNMFPVEFAPEFDYDTMFEKNILSLINRYMVTLGYDPIPKNLIVEKSLW